MSHNNDEDIDDDYDEDDDLDVDEIHQLFENCLRSITPIQSDHIDTIREIWRVAGIPLSIEIESKTIDLVYPFFDIEGYIIAHITPVSANNYRGAFYSIFRNDEFKENKCPKYSIIFTPSSEEEPEDEIDASPQFVSRSNNIESLVSFALDHWQNYKRKERNENE
jgi:hypothetical protein